MTYKNLTNKKHPILGSFWPRFLSRFRFSLHKKTAIFCLFFAITHPYFSITLPYCAIRQGYSHQSPRACALQNHLVKNQEVVPLTYLTRFLRISVNNPQKSLAVRKELPIFAAVNRLLTLKL